MYSTTDMLYEVTLTLKGPIRSKGGKDIHSIMLPFLRLLARTHRCSLITELHADGVPHWHGLVHLTDIREKQFFLDAVRVNRHIGRVSCTQVVYESSYRQYMIKDLAATRYVLGVDPVVHDCHGLTEADGQEAV